MVSDKNKKVKLIIEINCLNEEENLHIVFNKLPKKLKGIDIIETLVIDDGSTDNTVAVAKKLGANHVYRNHGNKGVPFTLNYGLYIANRLGADILINMDADDQHDPVDIPKLISPILNKKADIVHGQRPVSDVKHTTGVKKLLQGLGAWMVSVVAGRKIDDASSGYRALSMEAIARIQLLSEYAAPLEYLIQAENKGLNLELVEITPNEAVRPSRLIKSIKKYVVRSAGVIIDNLLVYKSLSVLLKLGGLFFVSGVGLTFIRLYLVNVNNVGSQDHLTLLISSISSMVIGAQVILFAFMARLSRANRRLAEEQLYRTNANNWGIDRVE